MVRVSVVCWSCDVRGSTVGPISCTAYQGEVPCGSCDDHVVRGDGHVTRGGGHVIRYNRAVVAYSRDAPRVQCIGGGREPVMSGQSGPVRSGGERCDGDD